MRFGNSIAGGSALPAACRLRDAVGRITKLCVDWRTPMSVVTSVLSMVPGTPRGTSQFPGCSASLAAKVNAYPRSHRALRLRQDAQAKARVDAGEIWRGNDGGPHLVFTARFGTPTDPLSLSTRFLGPLREGRRPSSDGP